MKKIYFIILFVCSSISSYSQAWPETAKLRAGDAQTDDNNGYSVSISGPYAITGAYHEDHDGTGGNTLSNAGSAYIYHYDSANKVWNQEAKLVAADRSLAANFGYSVALSGTYAVIGAVDDSGASGAAYVFERNGSGVWVQVAKLVATSRRPNDRFGVSVAISGDTIIVGAHHEDEDENDANTIQNAGSAYIFNRNGGTWSFFQKLVASDRAVDGVNDEFGISVGIDGNRVIVGAYRHDGDSVAKEKGAAYVFNFASGGWTELKILQAADRFHDDEFGWSVGVSGTYFIVGAPRHDLDSVGSNSKLNPGAVYIFDESNLWGESKVVATDRADQDNYGQSVAIYGNSAIVGAPLQNFGPPGENPPVLRSDGGAAYILKRNPNATWSQVKKLVVTEPDRFAGDKMGYSVDIDADVAISGASEDNVDSTAAQASAGAAYIFRKDTTTSVSIVTVNNMRIFPNPAMNKVHIQTAQNFTDLQVVVYDIYGKMLSQYQFSNNHTISISIGDYPAGIYLFDITDENGKTTKARIVKY